MAKPSGAAGRRKRREREEAAFTGDEPSPLPAEWLKRYEDIGPPPADGIGRVEWSGRLCALLIYEQLAAPHLRSPAERRLALEGIRTLGMTAVKALYEERLKKLEAKVYGRGNTDASDDGLEDEES